MRENEYQAYLIRKLKILFKDCVIIKNDSSYLQGIPDLLILFGPRWAMLEVKANYDSSFQPNQEYYVDLLNDMSFAAFIYPQNEQEVLNALQQALQPRRAARLS